MVEVQVIKANKVPDNLVLRIAAYCRVSSDSDDQQNSFINQVHTYTKYINSQPNMELVDVYADEGITGTAMNKRDDFIRMMRDCRKGEIDRILVKSVSRFARNTMECLETIRELKSKGITVLFEKENIDTGKMTDEILITVMSSIAQSESLSISKNLKMMNRNRMENGTYISRMAPYGYIYKDRTYVIDESKSEIVRRIFTEYLSGNGAAVIANKLNADGIPPNDKAERWYINTIYKILRNEKYVGDTLMQKTYHEDDLPYTPRKNNGELEKYYVYNTHEPIIDRETFEATQELLKKNHRQKGITTVNSNPLYRMIVCGNCGNFFKRKVIRNNVYWICYNHNIRNEYCKMKPVSEISIINAFNVMYSKLKLNSLYILDQAIAQMNELRTILRQGNIRIGEIDKRLAELNEKKHIIIKLNNKQFMDDITYQTEKNAIENEISELRRERKQQLANEHEDDVFEQLTELQSIINCKLLCNDNFDSELFRSIVEKIIVIDENNITFVLLGGFTLNEHLERNESNEA